jgi:hypothetical protein
MGAQNDTDLRIEVLATRQGGIVTRKQLREMGLGGKAISYRVRIGRLLVQYGGVYAVGHRALSREGRWLAAVLACGDGAVLSHFDAAALWDMAPNRSSRIHVTRPSTSGRAPDPARIRLHRVGTLRAWEGTRTEGIPATTPARTLLDLSRHLRPRAIEDVIRRADRLGLFDLLAVRRCLDEHPRQPGAPRLRRLLDDLYGVGAADLRSVLEVRFLQLCDDHGLPAPLANARVAGMLVDFLWPETRLIVETDGYVYHSTRAAFERDRDRDQHLTLAGYTVVRFTYHQVTQTPEAVAHRIRRLLA